MKAEARVKELETIVATLTTTDSNSSASTLTTEQTSQLGELNKVRHQPSLSERYEQFFPKLIFVEYSPFLLGLSSSFDDEISRCIDY